MASPEAVMHDVTVPIENTISGIAGLNNIQSTSSENMSLVMAQFDFGTDMDVAENSVTESLNGLGFPVGVQKPRVMALNIGLMPVIMMSLVGDIDPGKLEEIANERVVPEIESVEGVFLVELTGARKKQVSVTISPALLNPLRISMSQITGIMKANNLSLPVGSITTEEMVMPIRTSYRYNSLEDIGNTVVGVAGVSLAPDGVPPAGMPSGAGLAMGQGEAPSGTMPPSGVPPSGAPAAPPSNQGLQGVPRPIRLKDVAHIELAPSREVSISRTNNKPSLGIMITKDAAANTVDVANAVMEKVEEMRGELVEGVELVTFFDQSTLIERSIDQVVRDALIGAICAILVIFFFLLSVRLSLIVAISIPLSILVAFLLMSWQGITINMLTLSALGIAIGRLVDDSIVVLENVHRHYQGGASLKQAALEGTREVIVPITAATLTTVAIFLPLALVGGLVGEMFVPFALTVTFALLASLVIAITVVPTLSSFFMAKRAGPQEHDNWYQRLYTQTLKWALNHRAVTLVIATALFFGSFALLPFIGTAFFPTPAEKMIQLSIEMPPGTDMATTLRKAVEVEGIISENPAVRTYSTTINTGSGTMSAMRAMAGGLGGGESSANMFVALKPDADLKRESSALREAMEPIGGDSAITVSSMEAGSTGTNNVRLVVTANRYTEVEKATRDIVNVMAGVEGLSDIRSDVTSAKPEIAISVDPASAMIFGLTTAQIAMQVQELITGQTVTTVELDGRPVDVYVAMEPSSMDSLEEIKRLRVGLLQPVPLNQIASVKIVDGPIEIKRIDRKRAGAITATITKENVGAVNRAVQERIDTVDLPEDVEVKTAGVIEMMGETFSNMGVALLVAIALVYIVMVATMGSLLNPFIILFSLPLTAIGVFLSLFITQRTLGASALMGVLMLVGLVLTNAIVLLAFVQQLRKQGMGIFDALVKGGRIRLRPILMTALTTIFALFPLAIGLGEEGIIAAELGTVVIGGLVSSTFLTLIVIPVIYSLIENARGRKAKS
jgi:HAE1 family hydrophobic/amphiphilic exporter-1